MVICLSVGYVCDRFKIWMVWTLINILTGAGIFLMLSDMWHFSSQNLSIWYQGGFVMSMFLHSLSYMITLVYLSKLCNKKTRGTVFSIFGLIGSLGVLVISKVGGNLYTNHSKIWPPLIAFGL